MAHVRKQIRDRMASTISTGATLVSSRVYTTRVYPLTDANLPAITVYTGSEVSNRLNMGLNDLNRSLTVDVDIYVRATSTFDDDVDAIAVQIEEAIAGDFTVNGLAKEAVLTGTEIQFSGDAEQPIGVAKLTYSVRYVTALNDVEAAK
jgi:hypothetical protein